MQFIIIPPDSINKLAFPLKQWWGDLRTGAIYATFPEIVEGSGYTAVEKQ
jgi:hypothetical protein